MSKTIIGLVGFIGSGKGTVSDYLVNHYSFYTDSFAKSVKDVVAMIFHWPRHLLEGDTIESRIFRDTVDEWWSKELEIPNLTPRYLLQHIGTNVFRDHFNKYIWIATVKYRLSTNGNDVVISDARFPNEIQMIRDMGGHIVRIKRGVDPTWSIEYMINGIIPPDTHESEYLWLNHNFDYTLYNDTTTEDLYKQVDKLLLSI